MALPLTGHGFFCRVAACPLRGISNEPDHVAAGEKARHLVGAAGRRSAERRARRRDRSARRAAAARAGAADQAGGRADRPRRRRPCRRPPRARRADARRDSHRRADDRQRPDARRAEWRAAALVGRPDAPEPLARAPPQEGRRAPGPVPLRRVGRFLRALARSAARLLLRLLPRHRHDACAGAGSQARPCLSQADAARGRALSRHWRRLGRAAAVGGRELRRRRARHHAEQEPACACQPADRRTWPEGSRSTRSPRSACSSMSGGRCFRSISEPSSRC